jgi:hypothetical protein
MAGLQWRSGRTTEWEHLQLFPGIERKFFHFSGRTVITVPTELSETTRAFLIVVGVIITA